MDYSDHLDDEGFPNLRASSYIQCYNEVPNTARNIVKNTEEDLLIDPEDKLTLERVNYRLRFDIDTYTPRVHKKNRKPQRPWKVAMMSEFTMPSSSRVKPKTTRLDQRLR